MSNTQAAQKTKPPKTVTIIVNGEEHEVEKDDITFDEVVDLAFNPRPTGEYLVFLVSYRRGHGSKEGMLVEGESVKAKEGMIFDVSPTDKS